MFLEGGGGVCIFLFYYLRVIRMARFGAGGGGGGEGSKNKKKQLWQELTHQYCQASSEMTGGIITV